MDQKLFNSKRAAMNSVIAQTKKRKDILSQYGDLTPEQINSIAGLNFNDLKSTSTLLENSVLAMGKYTKEYAEPKFADDSAVGKAVYSNLYNSGYLGHFLGDTTSLVHKQTGAELQANNIKKVINTINYNKTTRKNMQDFQDVYKGIHNFADIMKNGGQVVAYDLETLGGTNSKGHQQLDFITELAAVVYDVDANGLESINKDKSMASLMGFSDAEYNRVKNYIKSLDGKRPGQLTSMDNVYIHRLSLLNDPKFKYEQQVKNGFEFRVKEASNPDDIIDSVDNALKGLDKYREIGRQQENYLKSTGFTGTLEDYKKEYTQQASNLIHKHEGLSDRTISLAHNNFNFDDNMFGMSLGQTVEHGFGKSLDTLQAMRYAQEASGIGAHIPKGFHTTNKYGPTTQDQLKSMFGLDKSGVAAHNAEEDSMTLFNILKQDVGGGKTYLNHIVDQVNIANKTMTDLKNVSPINGLTGRKPIFLMDKTGQKDWSMNKNGMSFAYNPTDGSIKTHDGFRISKDGKVTKENINGFGPKAGALYTHEFEEVKLDKDNWKQQFANLGISEEQYYQQYSTLDKLYIMRSQEYQDPAELAAKFGENSVFEDPTQYVTIFTNKAQIPTATGTMVGRQNVDGSAAWDYDTLNGLDLKTVTTDADGKIVINSVTGDEAGKMLMDRSMIRTSTESSARTIRDMPYERATKLHNYAKAKSQQETHRISNVISEMMAANKKGDIGTSQKLMGQLVSVLGYKNSLTGKMELKPETIAKSTILDGYTEAIAPILDVMEEEFNNMGLKNVKNSRSLKAKKDIIFQNVLTNVLEDMASTIPGDSTQLLSNAKPGIFTANELNRVDFLRSDVFPNVDAKMMGETIAGANSRYISLDLSKDTGILDLFFNNKFKGSDELRTSNAGFTALFDAYETIGSDDRFKGVWGNLTRDDLLEYQNGRRFEELNDVLTNKLKSFVSNQRSIEGNSGFGLKFARNIQDYSNVTDLSNMINSFSKDDIKSMVSGVMQSSNHDVLMADGSNSALVNKIVDKYFMTFSKDDLEKGIEGMSNTQKQWMRAQHGFSRQESESMVTDLLNSIQNTNITLGVSGTGKDSKMFLKQNGRVEFIDMHKYVLNNGIINHRMNGIDYATNYSYNVNNILTKQGKSRNLSSHDVMDNIKITSNVQHAVGKTRSFTDTVKSAKYAKEDIIDAIVYRNKSLNGLLREVGPMKQHNNFANTMKRAMYIDTNPIIGILPELKQAGIITQLEKDHYVDAETSQSFNSLINKIERGEFRPDRINDLLANEQNLYFHQYINPILEAINKDASLGEVGNISIKDLIKSINPHTQDTKLAAGYMSVDDNAYAHGIAKFDKTGRSVSIQTENQILYKRAELEKQAKKLAEHGIDVSVGGKLMTSAGDKYLNHAGKYTSGLTMKYLQIDSNSLKNIFKDDFNKARNGQSNKFSEFLSTKYKGKDRIVNAEEASKALAERVMSLSTYQQQSIMDARVHYAAFSKNNEQIINSKKQLIVRHTENVEVIEAVKKAHKLNFTIDKQGNVKYQLGYEVKRGDVLGEFGEEGNIIHSKYDGIFRGRVFDKDGNVLTEAELTNFVKVNNLIGKNEEVIKKAITKEYSFKHQVIKKYEDFGHKVANDASEKSTVDVIDLAFGTLDKKLAEELGYHGFKNLQGKYLSRDYIEYMKASLPSNANSLIERVLNEKFALSDALQVMFPQFKGVAQTTSLESAKHESISMAASNIVAKIGQIKDISEHEERALHRELFEGTIKYGNDGTIITDGITAINTKVSNPKLQAILEDKDFIKDTNGNKIGHTGYSHVTQLYDYEGGTFASNLDASELKKKQVGLEKKIFKLEGKGDKRSQDEQTKLDQYLLEKQEVEHQLGTLADQKGIKFDKRANLNLQKSVWNEDSISLTRSNFQDKAEFEKYFGHVLDSNGKVSSEYLGHSILDPATSVMRKRTLIGFGETKLSSLTGRKANNYKYLLDSYKDIANRISVEKAEKLYSLQQGVRAIEFNKKSSATLYNKLVKGGEHEYNRFKEVDLSTLKPNDTGWLNLDIGGQGHTVVHAENNPYTQNIMIKTGLGGKEEHLAIARMPERHFEDNLIKTSHIKKLNQLQSMLKEINGGNLGDQLESKQAFARKLVNDIKVSQIYDVTSKYGLAGDLSASRLSQSFFGKASSITYNYKNAFGKDSYEDLKALNGHSFLDKAMFDGKSLLQHYSEGKALDAVAFSEEAAEAMGYFSKDIMSKAGAKTKEDMINLLETKGDTFLATRFPRNQEASDKAVLGYLDRSLRGNQLKAVGHTGASMKMDHDGDEFGIGRLTDEQGHSYLTIADNATNNFVSSQKSMLMERAVNDNKYWDGTIRKRVEDVEGKIARSGSSIQDVAKKRIIDNKVYSAIMNSSESADYEKLLHKNDGMFKNMVDKAMSYKDKGDAHEDNINELKQIYGEGTEKYNKAKSDYVDAYRYQQYKDEFIAKSSKNSIGESNVTNLKIKELFMGTADKTAADYNFKSSLMYNMMYLTEEAAISSKSSIKGLDPNRAKMWNTHAKDLILGNGDAKEHVKAMKDWTKQYVVDDIDYDYYWNKSKVFRNIASQELNNGNTLSKKAFDDIVSNKEARQPLENRLVNEFVNSISTISKAANVSEHYKYASMGQSTTGFKNGITRSTRLANFDSPADEFVKAQEAAHPDLTDDIMKFLTVDDTVKSDRIGGPTLIDKTVSNAEELGEETSIGRKIFEGASDLFKEVKGNKIAMGAVGIAAGVMMLGYVGGRPRPADTQAMEEAGNNDYQEPQQQGLMDPGMMPMPVGGPQQGYVVNINARSNRGKQHAISAIQQAISQGTSSSVNISMNINDNYGNISDRDIQKAIKDAL
jgi:hypothetical protein